MGTDPDGQRLSQMMAYAAPIAAVFFFYVPMWSILPGIYAKYFGLKLTAIADRPAAPWNYSATIGTAGAESGLTLLSAPGHSLNKETK